MFSYSGGLPADLVKKYSGGKKKGKGKSEEPPNEEEADKEPIKILLSFKRFIFDPEKKMHQV